MAMLFCQLGQAHSLREICGGLACGEGQLKHLGVPVAPKRSTLAYANEHRPWELYQTVFEQTLCKCQELVQSQGGRQKFRFKNKLMSRDGSVIDLSVSMFDWAKFRRTKGAIKLHLPSPHARPPQISRNECACPNWQNSMAMNWPQLVKPRACRSALCSLTACSKSPRENSFNTCEKMLHTLYIG